MQKNFTIRDEIREYWSARAATFDEQVGHEIFADGERRAWLDLLGRHLGNGSRRRALDVASGTGVISHLLHDIGFEVTGLDWSEAMLAKARAKSLSRGANIRFVVGDAERTLEGPETYDVIVSRHLVWTLVDPLAAFADWFSVLKPGGRVLIVDGDFVSETFVMRLIRTLERLSGRGVQGGGNTPDAMRETHERILKQVYFSQGARAEQVADLLQQAGFKQPLIDRNLRAIQREQARQMPFWRSLERSMQHRYAVVATKA